MVFVGTHRTVTGPDGSHRIERWDHKADLKHNGCSDVSMTRGWEEESGTEVPN